MNWDNAPPPDATFWQLQAELVDGAFKVVTAQGPLPQPPRLEKLPESQWQQQRLQPSLSQPQLKPRQATTTASIDWEELTPVSGKLELTIKLNTLPQVKQAESSQVEFNSSEKPNPSAKPSATQAEAKPKKIGKFNVEVR